MNKRRIADLAQEWNEVIERLNYDDFQAWFLLLPEKERLTVAEKLVAGIIYFCRDYLTVPQDEPIWEMEEMMYCLSQVVQFIICFFLSPALCGALKVGAWNMDIP